MDKIKPPKKNTVTISVKIFAGVILAFTTFFVSRQYNTFDCHTIHMNVHSGGLASLGRLGLGIYVFTLLGAPLILSAALAGLMTAPIAGAALTSGFTILALASAFCIFRFLGRDHALVRHLEAFISRIPWFEKLQSSQSGSGMEWTAGQMQQTPLPASWFAAYCGALVRHLTLPSFIAGTFLATAVVIVTYSFVGAFVGCALVDYHFGLPINKYKYPIVLCVVLIFLMLRIRPRFNV